MLDAHDVIVADETQSADDIGSCFQIVTVTDGAEVPRALCNEAKEFRLKKADDRLHARLFCDKMERKANDARTRRRREN
ncbi:hypothetical protein BSNK01_04200 [Bacillaceae bacterium]